MPTPDDKSFSVWFGPDDPRNRTGLTLTGACFHAAASIRPTELAEILTGDVVHKLCKRGEIGPAYFVELSQVPHWPRRLLAVALTLLPLVLMACGGLAPGEVAVDDNTACPVPAGPFAAGFTRAPSTVTCLADAKEAAFGAVAATVAVAGGAALEGCTLVRRQSDPQDACTKDVVVECPGWSVEATLTVSGPAVRLDGVFISTNSCEFNVGGSYTAGAR